MIKPRWIYCEETDGEDNNGATGGGAAGTDVDLPAGEGGGDGGDAGDGGAAGGAASGGGDRAAGDPTKKGEAPASMKEAIDEALGYTGGVDGKGAAAKKPDDKGGDKGAPGKESETHYANGKPKKNEKGEALDDAGKVVPKGAAPKVKTAAELDLKPEERKFLNTKTQQRFGEMITTLKAHEATIAKQGTEVTTLRGARDAILGLMQETSTDQDQLAGYLYFNQLLHSKNAGDLESALEMVEAQRAGLYKALGREPEGGGLDLLADFPDLAKQVEEEEITRKAALEIAKARREKTARDAAVRRQGDAETRKRQSAEQHQKDGEDALSAIEKWTSGLSKSDLDYKAKEDKLLSKLDEVLKQYPPKQWLSTLKMLYEGIEIPKSTPAVGGGHKPLRPSGAKPGTKAPTSMLEAINQGLGYAGADKG